MATATSSSGAHLVGSVPLADSEAVFRAASERLGAHLSRIPDGETGVRTNWIQWQFPLLVEMPELEPADEPDSGFGPRLQLAAGVSGDELRFPELGYAQAALESWQVFSRLQDEGVIAADARFQVSLPTPLAVTHLRIVPRDQPAIEEAYERQMLAELDQVLDVVPHDRLAIQWDTAVEFALLEGLLESFLTEPLDEIVERLARLGDAVPEPVELGYHLCYGDVQHAHFIEPRDAGKLADVASGVIARLVRSGRALNWLHLPVPRDRSDAAYFAPLRDVRLPKDAALQLGLVHLSDGLDGARRRIAAARTAVSTFGVATECGFGRRAPETIPDLLDLHAAVCEELPSPPGES